MSEGHTGDISPDYPQIRTREAAHKPLHTAHTSINHAKAEAPQIKVKDTAIHRQIDCPSFEKERLTRQSPAPPECQPFQPIEQQRQKYVQEQKEKAASQRVAHRQRPDGMVPVQQQGSDFVQSERTAPPSTRANKQPAKKTVGESAPNRKHWNKRIRPETKTIGRTSRQAVKMADSSRQAVQASARSMKSVKAAQQTAQAAVQAQQRAVQTASGAKQAAVAVGRPVTQAVAVALRGAVTDVQNLMAALAAGGRAVIPVVLVLCLVGALLLSPLGIFFSGEDSGTGLTMPAVIREINQEYDTKVEELKAGASGSTVELSGTRAAWPEILAVYAVKTVTDPTNGMDVISMDDTRKELLKQVFWDMNELSSFTSTVPGEEGEENTTTFHIVVSGKTADEMADLYGFNSDQRKQLAELLSDEYQALWNAVLYGIGTGDGEIVAVALSQVGNIGGQPYWSWYGFGSWVNWCATFVSWCANECGYIDAGVVPKFSSCTAGSRWFKDQGRWQDRSYTPNPGDIIFFDWDDPGGFSGPQDGLPDHVGIVERVENGRVYTIEGNSGDKCCQRSYPVGYYEIYGYGAIRVD